MDLDDFQVFKFVPDIQKSVIPIFITDLIIFFFHIKNKLKQIIKIIHLDLVL